MSATEIQDILRFLTKDAKVPLATAMGKVKALQEAKLCSPEELERSNLDTIKTIFPEEKIAKQVLNAAKRLSKKRGPDGQTLATPPKRRRADPFETPDSKPAWEVEGELELPVADIEDGKLEQMTFISNRAPLVLAFAVTLLKFTMPQQPPSSRLSLAQAVVSEGARGKAKSIGLKADNTAEEEGWGQGQPVVKVMNREIRVLRRWGYDWKNPSESHDAHSESEIKRADAEHEDDPALWGVDLEQLKALNGPLTFPSSSSDTAGLPVYSPQSARNYLYRSFDIADTAGSEPKKKTTATQASAQRAHNVACLLRAIELLFESWSSSLSHEELDHRAWSWYVQVRPEVEYGVAGWGAKGPVKLRSILELRKT